MRFIYISAAAWFAVVPGAAIAAEEDTQIWSQTVAQGPISGDVVYHAELQSRFGNDVSEVAQLLIRPAIGVRVNGRISVYQGYAYVRTPQAMGETIEHRSFQQLNWSLGQPGGVALSARTRLEQRWLSNGEDTGHRLRQMIRAAVPLQRGKGPALLGWSEGFFALNGTDWGARGGLDRVRTFAGVEVPVSGRITVEAGYLNQYVRRAQMHHVGMLALMLRP